MSAATVHRPLHAPAHAPRPSARAVWARALLGTLSAVACLTACQPDFNVATSPAPLDEPYFRCRVQPVLTKTCAMFACHGADGTSGTANRYFRLYGRSRLRWPDTPEAMRNSMMTAQERTANFVAARALVDVNNPDQSVLLQKPLDQQAGGWFHRGAELYGQGDVFLSTDDPDYRVLSAWVRGAKDDPTCIEPGSNL